MLLAACGAIPSTGFAFGLSGVGGKLGYTNPEDLDGTVTVGGHLEFEQSGSQLHLLPNLMYWNSDGMSDLNPNFDVYYHFRSEGHVTPYLGGGLGLHLRGTDGNSDTDLGANVIGGLRIPGAAHHYFVEARYTTSDVSQLGLLGGVTFHMR